MNIQSSATPQRLGGLSLDAIRRRLEIIEAIARDCPPGSDTMDDISREVIAALRELKQLSAAGEPESEVAAL